MGRLLVVCGGLALGAACRFDFERTPALDDDGGVTPADGAVSGGDATATWPDAGPGLDAGVLTTAQRRIAAGEGHTCVALGDDSVYCWGANGFGQLGGGAGANDGTPALLPLTAPGGLRGGRFATCALNSGASCWGDNDHQMLGSLAADPQTVPVQLMFGGLPWVGAVVDPGNGFSCLISLSDVAHCFGHDSSGELGNGMIDGLEHPDPVAVAGIDRIVAISTGDAHACAQSFDGRLWCWGSSFYGQVGDGNNSATAFPQFVAEDVVAVSAGHQTTCAVHSHGEVSCWGRNDSGQVGDGSLSHRNRPVMITGLSPVAAIGVGTSHTCALHVDGTVSCWGDNASGQLGDSATAPRPDPGLVPGVDGVVEIAVGKLHVCARRDDGCIWCWGSNGEGQLGIGTVGGYRAVANLANVACM